MFIDKVKIFIKAGNGGKGGLSFHREKYVAQGGPDGGNGGKGGDIIFKVKQELNNLVYFHYSTHFKAENGEDGAKKNCYGKNGKDLVIYVPRGTIIRDAETNEIIADVFYEDKDYVILKGGKGGRGNACFATPTRQAPHFSETGEQTKEYAVILELKTIADVGLLGFPNVGKSTLLSVISSAKPKIANYFFTTITPNLGVAKYYDSTFVVADIPGLIEGASEGVGLGFDFLRHIERTRILVHVVDISAFDGREPYNDFCVLNEELRKYNPELAEVPQIIALNKCDLLTDKTKIDEFKAKAGKKYPIVCISATSNNHLDDLLKEIAKLLKTLPPIEPLEIEKAELDKKDTTSINITKIDEGYFELSGGYFEQLIRGIVVDDYESLSYFQKRLKNDGIMDKLREAGAKNGDTIKIGKVEFEMVD